MQHSLFVEADVAIEDTNSWLQMVRRYVGGYGWPLPPVRPWMPLLVQDAGEHDLACLQIAEIRNDFRLNDVRLGVPDVLLQPGSHVLTCKAHRKR